MTSSLTFLENLGTITLVIIMIFRLDRFISNQCGQYSRSDVKAMIKKRQILVNGKNATDSGMKINTDTDTVICKGETIIYKEHIYIMLNKPQGVVCSTRDGKSPTVLSLVPKELYRDGLFPAGRLDKDTEGFVLITDDGDLAHRMLSPKSHVEKEYYARLAKPFEEGYKEQFEKGIRLDEETLCLPAQIFAVQGEERACRIILHEGMFHQVKRMMEAVGNEVVYLRRDRIGNLRLCEKLALGDCLEIMHKEDIELLCPNCSIG